MIEVEKQMKDWQHGIELDELKRLEVIWSDYNSNIKSPFSSATIECRLSLKVYS